MARLDPAVAAGRLAVRRALAQLSAGVAGAQDTASARAPAIVRDMPGVQAVAGDAKTAGDTVLVACSGGTDSLALAAVTAFEAPRRGWRAGATVIDHGLLAGSSAVARRAQDQCRELGLDPVEVIGVEVGLKSGEGVEAAARQARYEALEEAAGRHGAAAVLLAHTLDDQAETVLLAMARGSGMTALTAMAPRRGVFIRPWLELTRVQTEAIMASTGLKAWQDPTNFPGGPYDSTRSLVRAQLVPTAKAILGPGFAKALARTAAFLAQDLDYLNAQAAALLERAQVRTPTGPGSALALDAATLAAAHPAVRTRAIHRAAVAAGADPGGLNASQIEAVDRLIADWHGQGEVYLAGRIQAGRKCGKLELRAMSTPGSSPKEA
ncbi:MAG: tRNA lysidine(34) synthetase TilS [Bifidobacteriaceae bacterium]|jgi:tRNA(Ile)-lysidine synthase|nr:tRNA lysidine(34) synthetase TilS [Bifidobacteriaceae bacterium]